MFICGKRIINDHNFDVLFNHLSRIKAVRGKDYFYHSSRKIILRPTKTILSSPIIYQYEICPIGLHEKVIQRKIDTKNKKIIDYVFSPTVRDDISSFGPITFGWSYDFDFTSVINGTMALINGIPIKNRHDPMFVATYLCSHLDAFNDPKNGIIQGCWDKTFVGGNHPSSWSGSGEIFRKRSELKKPVQYGQCWVLADLLVGIFRFIGIPSRSVRINKCIIDVHDLKGMDVICEHSQLYHKSENITRKHILNPREFMKEKNVAYFRPLISNVNKKICKGVIFSCENTNLKISSDDLHHSLNNYCEKESRSWNFHVWVEFYVKNDWYVLDPCPLLDIIDKNVFLPYLEPKQWPEFNGLRYFGPVKISDIRENKQSSLFENATFKYIHSCINGQIRYWIPFIVGGKNILYLFNVDYKSTSVIARNRNGDNVNITNLYRKDENFYDNFHMSHPIFIRSNGNDLTKIFIFFSSLYADSENTNYMMQMCLLFGNQILYIYREKLTSLSIESFKFMTESSVKKYRKIADRLTLTIYNLSSKEFWSQCIKV